MVRIWAEVYTAAGAMQGIVNPASMAVTKRLDRTGEIRLDVAASDANAADLLDTWRRVKLYRELPLGGRRLVGSGILLQKRLAAASSGDRITWSGLDGLHELSVVNVLRGLVYDAVAIETIAKDLVDRVGGWKVRVDTGLGTTSRRYDGKSVLSALIGLVEGAGLHMRLRVEQYVEVGAFGADSGVRVTNAREAARRLEGNSTVAIIDSMDVVTDGHDIRNWIEPVFGNGDAVLTLKRSTRTSPYTIQTTTGPDGRTVYYLKDAASIALYGEVQDILQMEEAPYIAADALVNAANALYDWAAAKLARIAVPQQSFSVHGRKLDKEVLPGDQVRVAYNGLVYVDGEPVNYATINQMMWVIGATERYDAEGASFDWEVSNVDAPTAAAADILADAVRAQRDGAISMKMTANAQRYTGSGTMSPSTPLAVTWTTASVIVDIGRATVTVSRDSATGPNTISVDVDGAEAAGGAWLWGDSTELTFSVDVDDLFTTIPGDHTVTVSCLYGSGDVDVAVEVVEVGVSVT